MGDWLKLQCEMRDLQQELEIRIKDNVDLYAKLCNALIEIEEYKRRLAIMDAQNKRNHDAFNQMCETAKALDEKLTEVLRDGK